MKPLNGPMTEGKMHFDIINLAALPPGAHIETKITNTADGSGMRSSFFIL